MLRPYSALIVLIAFDSARRPSMLVFRDERRRNATSTSRRASVLYNKQARIRALRVGVQAIPQHFCNVFFFLQLLNAK